MKSRKKIIKKFQKYFNIVYRLDDDEIKTLEDMLNKEGWGHISDFKNNEKNKIRKGAFILACVEKGYKASLASKIYRDCLEKFFE